MADNLTRSEADYLRDAADTTQTKNDFDLVAPIYDNLASLVFAGAVRRAQLALLPQIVGTPSVLIIGGGTGWFLLALLRKVRPSRVLYVEKSARMLRYSRELIQREAPEFLGCVEFRLGTELSLSEADGSFELVVTNFFLDLFSPANAAQVAETLSRRLTTMGRWLLTDFQLPARGLLRWYARVLFRVMFTFFNVLSNMESRNPPDYARILGALGLSTRKSRTFYGTMIHTRLLQRG